MQLSHRAADHATSGKTRRHGFTLVEILVATILISIAAVALASYTGHVAKARMTSQRQSLALVAAQEAIEDVRRRPYAEVAPGATSVTTVVGKTSLKIITTVTAVGTKMKTVEVSVRTSANGQLQFLRTTIFKEIT